MTGFRQPSSPSHKEKREGLSHRTINHPTPAPRLPGGGWRIKLYDVIELLRYLFLVRGYPVYLRSDNDFQFTAEAVKRFLKELGVDTLFIGPGIPWENGYVESFNRRVRDELLDGELFLHIDEMKYIVERWRMDYNHYRLHSSLDCRATAAFAAMCLEHGSGSLRLTQDKESCCEILS